jgi:hypothetical protein
MRLAARVRRLERAYDAGDLGPGLVERWVWALEILARANDRAGRHDRAAAITGEVGRLKAYLDAGRYAPRVEDACRERWAAQARWKKQPSWPMTMRETAAIGANNFRPATPSSPGLIFGWSRAPGSAYLALRLS